jgi:hypothetical protein
MDDMYPQDGSIYDETRPSEQELEQREEQSKVEQSFPILDELIAKREDDIKRADSLTSLGINSSMPTLQAQIILEGNTRYISLLTSELESLKEFRERYK